MNGRSGGGDPVAASLTVGEAGMRTLGESLAIAARAGDRFLLQGDLGAGKSTLARHVIRALARNNALDVPSPTYTLVQTYDLDIPVLHADLYRIMDETEIEMLGLEDGRDGQIQLIEWPERAPSLTEGRAVIHVALSGTGETRHIRIAGDDPRTLARIQRSLAIRDFLDRHGQDAADREPFPADASARAYEFIHPAHGETMILMNAPRTPDGPPVQDGLPYSQLAHLAENVRAFVGVASALRSEGFAAPAILAADLEAGLVLLEHLGSGRIVTDEKAPIEDRYAASVELLADLHQRDWSATIPLGDGTVHTVPTYSRRAMMAEVSLLSSWYAPYRLGRSLTETETGSYFAAWTSVLDDLEANGPETTLVLRDHHSPNIIWREGHSGLDRVGLIDFQDAVMGPTAYDVASIVRDARIDMAEDLQSRLLDGYCRARKARPRTFDETRFRAQFEVMAAQRNAKVLGIFVRLNQRDGKPQYLAHLPRIERYFSQSLADPALAPVREALAAIGLRFEDRP